MKITKRQLRRIIKEEKRKMLKEYSEHESHSDVADYLEDMLAQLDDVIIKYVDSGWLASQDHASLALDLEELHEKTSQLSTTFNVLAARGTTK